MYFTTGKTLKTEVELKSSFESDQLIVLQISEAGASAVTSPLSATTCVANCLNVVAPEGP